MVPQLKRLKDLLGISLNWRHGMAVLERVHASALRADERALVSRIMRATLKLPAAPVHKPSAPEAPAPAAHLARRRQ